MSTSSISGAGQEESETYKLMNSDNPTSNLVRVLLTGHNYLSLSRSMLIALRAKDKQGFINGHCPKPATDSCLYEKWLWIDSMVIYWILNSISKEIVEAFLYTENAQELRKELKQRFGESNGPMLYQIKQEISVLTQGNSIVMVYFTKLKKLWDELACMRLLPVCTYGASKQLTELDNEDKLVQFLMGLNDSYDNAKNQILLMEPFPSVNRAYSMILRIEKQREAHNLTFESNDNTAMYAQKQTKNFQKPTGNYQRMNKDVKNFYKRNEKYCQYYKSGGHNKDTCFKPHGYPDWYYELKQKNAKANTSTLTIMPETPLSELSEETSSYGNLNDSITKYVQQEVMKAMKGKGQENQFSHEVSTANIASCAGFAD